ncbi:MAG: pantoate--beta-alanine ligase [Cytophagaceae bacterium]|jgi:pantoate--beta-alanine ligase|nr:pantoate--beta-alanine ligase [Cytophagaceae bacterium]
MIVLHTLSEYRNLRRNFSSEEQTVGFVPTMGALHEGHLSLVEQSKRENDRTVVSIFVNPLQFNNAEDYEKYPLTLKKDIQLLESVGCDILFAPSKDAMYPRPVELQMEFGAITSAMEGASRPGHFSGVGVVVSKLFNIIQPTRAYFGQKDIQQLCVIRQLVEDLNFPIQIVSCPIARNEKGLALSSRNQRLSPEGLELASQLYRTLIITAEQSTLTTPQQAISVGLQYLKNYPDIRLDYLEIVDTIQLKSLSSFTVREPFVICIAAYVEGVRLIDNLIIQA